jgi:hypothetical protein
MGAALAGRTEGQGRGDAAFNNLQLQHVNHRCELDWDLSKQDMDILGTHSPADHATRSQHSRERS